MNDYLKIDAAVQSARRQLEAVSDSPRLDAEMLLARALDVPRSYLIAHGDEEMDVAAMERLNTMLSGRVAGKPMAYIVGEKEFWSMPLLVTPDTLVPRPETEILVDQVLRFIPRDATFRIADLGTGSGAVALAVAKERPLCHVVAVDLSEAALIVARENARQLAIPNIEFRQGDWLAPLHGLQFDIIAANPPYVATGDPHLDSLSFEPIQALEAGSDGLDAIRHLSGTAAALLTCDGRFCVEHGADQAESVAAILANDGWQNIELARDLAGLPRVSTATV